MYIEEIKGYKPRTQLKTTDFLELYNEKLSDSLKKQILKMKIETKNLCVDVQKLLTTNVMDVKESGLDIAVSAIEQLNTDLKEFDYLISLTDSSEEYISPSLSSLLVSRLGFRRDISHWGISGMGCGSLVKALEMAKKLVQSEEGPSKALIGVSVFNSIYYRQYAEIEKFYTIKEIDKMDISEEEKEIHRKNWQFLIQYHLFGDAASAIVVSNRPEPGSLKIEECSNLTNLDNDDWKSCYFLNGGAANFTFDWRPEFVMTKDIPAKGLQYAQQLFENYKDLDIKKWAVHTGSDMILKLISRSLKIERSKMRESFDVYHENGNITPASLCFILEKIFHGDELVKGDKMGLLGFGTGFQGNLALLEKM